MAEPNPQVPARGRRGAQAKKLSTRVDLTPMVDLGFLLITFFIVSTTLSLPVAMPLAMPAVGDSTPLAKSTALTFIAVGNNEVFYYPGEWSEAEKGHFYSFSAERPTVAIRRVITAKQAQLDRSNPNGRRAMTVLIKAVPGASYGSVVQLLNEMAVDQVKRYSLVALTEGERRFVERSPKQR